MQTVDDLNKTVVAINNVVLFKDQLVTQVTLDSQYQNYKLFAIAVNNGNDIIIGPNPYLKIIVYVVTTRVLTIERVDTTSWYNKYATAFMIKI